VGKLSLSRQPTPVVKVWSKLGAGENPHSRREFALEFFNQMWSRAAEGGQPQLGLHILMGASTPEKVASMIANLERDLIAPTEIIARAI
jgi:hypothetical protein